MPLRLSWEELRQPVDFRDNLLGNRFLERGQGLILYGPAGCGKSVAALQAVAEWAAGLDGLHIKPTGPLKTVLLQTEDSINEHRENLDGILNSSAFTPELLALVKKKPDHPGGSPQRNRA
jgi:RecA-family ATPase